MKNKKHTPLLAALATLVVLLAGVVLIWLAEVRPDVGKGRSEIVTDFLRAELLQDGQTATQVFTYDKDILTIGLEFYLPGDQPCGALDVVLYDADTGEEAVIWTPYPFADVPQVLRLRQKVLPFLRGIEWRAEGQVRTIAEHEGLMGCH